MHTLLLLACIAYAEGDRDGPDYVYRDGYWWYKDGTPVVRIYDAPSYYYSYGYRYEYPRTYQYYRIPVYKEVAKAASYTPPSGWQSELIRAAAARDEQNAYFGALKYLGLGAPIPAAYSSYPSYVSNANLGSFGANANTLYGYSYEQVRQAYGDANFNTYMQQSSQLARGAQGLAGDAVSQFNASLTGLADNQARIMEYLAKGNAAANALRAAELPPSSRTTTVVQGSGQGVAEEPTVPVAVASSEIRQQKCAGCHAGKDAKGKFRVQDFDSYTEEQKAAVVLRLLTTDKDRRMPKDGQPLTMEQISQFLAKRR
jgi:hypothetical protein